MLVVSLITIVTFFPSDTTFTEIVFVFETLQTRIRELAFLNSCVSIHLQDLRGGEEKSEHFKYEGGVSDNNRLYFLSKTDILHDLNFDKIKQDLYSKDVVKVQIPITDDIPKTPFNKDYSQKIDLLGLPLLNLYHKLDIYPVVYEGENYGKLIRHVAPMKFANQHISSHGAQYDFCMHVDNPDLSIYGDAIKSIPSPDTLGFVCLRNNDKISTNILLLDDILQFLTQTEISLLCEPVFNIKRPDSFEGQNLIVKNLPLLNYFNGKYYSRFDTHNVFSDKTECNIILDKIKHIANNNNLIKEFILQKKRLYYF